MLAAMANIKARKAKAMTAIAQVILINARMILAVAPRTEMRNPNFIATLLQRLMIRFMFRPVDSKDVNTLGWGYAGCPVKMPALVTLAPVPLYMFHKLFPKRACRITTSEMAIVT